MDSDANYKETGGETASDELTTRELVYGIYNTHVYLSIILFMLIELFILIGMIFCGIFIYKGLRSFPQLVDENNRYQFISVFSSTIELILIIILLYIVLTAIFEIFIEPVILQVYTDEQDIVKKFKEKFSIPFILSISSILVVTLLTIVLDLYTYNKEYLHNQTISNLTSTSIGSQSVFFIYGIILIVVISLALLCINKLVRTEGQL